MRLKGNNETVGWLVYGMTVFLLYFTALAKKKSNKTEIWTWSTAHMKFESIFN